MYWLGILGVALRDRQTHVMMTRLSTARYKMTATNILN